MISRNYRGDIDFGIIDKFIPVLTEREEEGNITPLITTAGVTFAYVKFNNLYRKYADPIRFLPLKKLNNVTMSSV